MNYKQCVMPCLATVCGAHVCICDLVPLGYIQNPAQFLDPRIDKA